MDLPQIKKKATELETKENLLDLLNEIKQEDLQEQAYPFTIKQLNYYCNPNRTKNRYITFEIPKKAGGTRVISSPSNGLKSILHYLNYILQSIHTPSKFAMGFVKGKSIIDNASQHTNQNYVFNIDLKDFFPSIHQARVWKRLQLPPFNFNKEIASIVAGLCCMKVEPQEENEKPLYVLPQGAPTSPTITNIICDNLDRRLGGLAKRFGLRYSRYADDITFSSMHNVYQNDSDFRKELERIITDQHFTINEKKTRLQKLGSRQEVTGLIVSHKINVTKKYVREIRSLLYMWEKYGYNVAYCKFFPKYTEEKGRIYEGIPDLISVIAGKLMYLKMVKGDGDTMYTRLFAKFQKLANKETIAEKTNLAGVTYLGTIGILEFEKYISTTIIFEITEKCNLYAYFKFNEKKIMVSVNKSLKHSLTLEEAMDKGELAISLCRGKEGKPFWLIHRKDKVLVPPLPLVDVDELNVKLDSLLLFS
ncbi:MAG: RNA-directed DNA polymerase [Bacteroidales bacterium]|nr:RNA-directed DNA polymerase [Bacteroidales bacterium]